MPISEARKRANAAYNRRQDNIMLRPSKEEGARIREAAKAAGLSVQAYMLGLFRTQAERENCLGSGENKEIAGVENRRPVSQLESRLESEDS